MEILAVIFLTILRILFTLFVAIPMQIIHRICFYFIEKLSFLWDFVRNIILLFKGERTLVIDFGAIYRYVGLWKDDDSSSEGEEIKRFDSMNKICE